MSSVTDHEGHLIIMNMDLHGVVLPECYGSPVFVDSCFLSQWKHKKSLMFLRNFPFTWLFWWVWLYVSHQAVVILALLSIHQPSKQYLQAEAKKNHVNQKLVF